MPLTDKDKAWIQGLVVAAVKAILFGVEDIVLNRGFSAKEHFRKFLEDVGIR